MKHTLFSQSKYAALLCMLLILPAWFSRLRRRRARRSPGRVDVSVAVVTPDGKPVPNADLTVGEGARHLRADEAGRIVFSVAPRDLVTVSAEGFTPVRALGSALAESSQVTLTPAVLLAGEGDDVPLPYTSLKKRWSVGSSVVIRGEELEKYSSTDIRNAPDGAGQRCRGCREVRRSRRQSAGAHRPVRRLDAHQRHRPRQADDVHGR